MNSDDRSDLIRRLRSGTLSRRGFVAMAGAGLAAGSLCRPALADPVTEVRFDGWGGIVSEAFRRYAFDPYTAATGIEVIDGTFASSDEYLARVRAGQPGDFHVFHANGVFDYVRYVELDMDVVLDEANIPNLRYVMPAMQAAYRNITDGRLSAVPYDYGTTGIAFNTTVIDAAEVHEKGAAILNDRAYAGRIGGDSDWRTRIWYAALQTGQHPNRIIDIEAIWDALRTHRDGLLRYWSSGAELMALLAQGEIVLTDAWSGRIGALQQQGLPIGYYDPPNAFAWQECLMVLRGSPLPEVEELLNFMLEPEVAIAVAEGQNYPPSLDPTLVDLGDFIPTLPGFDPTGRLENLTFADPIFWNSNEAAWSAEFGRIMAGF